MSAKLDLQYCDVTPRRLWMAQLQLLWLVKTYSHAAGSGTYIITKHPAQARSKADQVAIAVVAIIVCSYTRSCDLLQAQNRSNPSAALCLLHQTSALPGIVRDFLRSMTHDLNNGAVAYE